MIAGRRSLTLRGAVAAALLMAALAMTVAVAGLATNSPKGFVDPLDAPAAEVANPARKPMMAIARAGKRLIAVGMRGLILRSDDGGRSWTQARSPVQSDLTAVCFSGAQSGWIVGHDGVILATSDGGDTWVRQLDGRLAGQQFPAYYHQRVAAGQAQFKAALTEVERNYKNGPALPFLDVVFDDARVGFAVGPFGMVAATEDGGRSWVPALERVDNPKFLSLYAARKIGDELYLAGERGMVYRYDRARRTFVGLPTGYTGSLFGIVGQGSRLVAYGLRGVVATSVDAGASWSVNSLPVPAGLVGADVLEDGRVVVASITGTLWFARLDEGRFTPFMPPTAAPATAVLFVGPDQVVLSGPAGVGLQAVPALARR